MSLRQRLQQPEGVVNALIIVSLCFILVSCVVGITETETTTVALDQHVLCSDSLPTILPEPFVQASMDVLKGSTVKISPDKDCGPLGAFHARN